MSKSDLFVLPYRSSRRFAQSVMLGTVLLGGCADMAKPSFVLPMGAEQLAPPATEEEVQAVERQLGARLPEEYREFLLTINGALGDFEIHTYINGVDGNPYKETYYINQLFTVSRDPIAPYAYHVLDWQNAYDFKRRYSKRRLMIIGRTMGMDQICMSLAGPDRGKVYYWYPPSDADAWDKAGLDNDRLLTPLADNFREFWSKLRIEQTDE